MTQRMVVLNPLKYSIDLCKGMKKQPSDLGLDWLMAVGQL